MSQSLDAFCDQQLKEIRSLGLYRQLRKVGTAQSATIELDGRKVLNFSSNDYLGLASDALMKKAAVEAVETYGIGAGASPLISGALQPIHELQTAIANLKGTEASLVFNTGYATATGTLPALFGRNDILILDKLSHACLVDGAKMSRAKLRVFRHNDMHDLERILQWAVKEMDQRAPSERGRICILVESVYSMDGDMAPLVECVRLKDAYGAFILVDEAHATGVLGNQGEGFIGSLGLSDSVDIQMGTLGKAIGCSGGFIAGSQHLIELLVNKARSLIFSTAPSPLMAATARQGIAIIRSELGERRRKQLFHLMETFWEAVPSDWRQCLGQGKQPMTPILPWHVGEARDAVRLSEHLLQEGYFVPAIRFPTVPQGSARLRITLSAVHQDASVRDLASTLVACHGAIK